MTMTTLASMLGSCLTISSGAYMPPHAPMLAPVNIVHEMTMVAGLEMQPGQDPPTNGVQDPPTRDTEADPTLADPALREALRTNATGQQSQPANRLMQVPQVTLNGLIQVEGSEPAAIIGANDVFFFVRDGSRVVIAGETGGRFTMVVDILTPTAVEIEFDDRNERIILR